MPGLPPHLQRLLRRCSRSFYLTLAVLPGPLRVPLGLAYLVARAADTIADTRLLPPADRLRHLGTLRGALDVPQAPRLEALAGPLAAGRPAAWEADLVAHLEEIHAHLWRLPNEDLTRVQGLLHRLIQGMQAELQRFPPEDAGRLVALETREDLLRHTYYAAGCVGEFWTGMAVAHRPRLAGWNLAAMAGRGRRFGQGLQLTNVLRDLPRDLQDGRCYLPRQDLARHGLSPDALRDPAIRPRLQPLLDELLALALDCYADGWSYTLAVPTRELRLRLACAWPLLLGLATLERIQQAPELLDPAVRLRISRREVYGILARSTALAWTDAGLTRVYRGAAGRVGRGASPGGSGRTAG